MGSGVDDSAAVFADSLRRDAESYLSGRMLDFYQWMDVEPYHLGSFWIIGDADTGLLVSSCSRFRITARLLSVFI